MNFRSIAKLRIVLVALFLFLVCAAGYAQQNSEIDGTVTDKQGAVVPNAKVTLTEPSTGFTRETTSNAAGAYSFPGLNIGTYDLKITAAGFEAVAQQGIQLNISQTMRADIALTVGSVNETVTVAANALQVQADSNVVSTLISADQISEIATENRNLTSLATLGLGVSSGLPDSNTPTSVASSSFISVNGLRHAHNIWLIDGGEADDRGGAGGASIMPSQDAIAQFEMLTSNYPPDYGISSGATISLAIKSGTSHYHGTLWEFNRNTVYDANSYTNKLSNPITPRQQLNYNIYGFNVGGPIFIPKVYNNSRQRTFFFWNEEWRKLKQGSQPNAVQTLPTADFPTSGQDLHYVAPAYSSGLQLKVPVTNSTNPNTPYNQKLAALGLTPGQPFPNNTIPASLLDPNAILYLGTGVIPKPNTSNDNIISSANQPINVRDDVVRIDHQITDKYQILGHYLGDSVTQSYAAPMLGWSGASYNTITSVLNNPSNSAAVKLSATLSPDLLVEASFNYDGNVIGITNSPNSLVPAGWGVNRFFGNSSKNLPNISFGAPYNVSENPGSAPWKNAARDYSPKVDISYTVGKHAMKYGFSYNRYTKNQQIFGDPGGNFGFGSLTNDSVVDFMLGLASSYDQAQALPIRHYVNQTTSAYVLDNWRVTPRITLQLGLRYDALPHAYERNNDLSNFDPSTYIPVSNVGQNLFLNSNTNQLSPTSLTSFNGGSFYLNGIQIAGQNHFPKGLVQNDYNTLQPRVGFSSDLLGNGKTILRGGIGSFFERVQGNDVYNAAANEPFFNDPKASNVLVSDPHTTWVDGSTAALPNFAQSITTLATTYKAPGVVQYSLGVQHEVVPSVIWVVQYVGNLAWHQPVRRQINNYALNTPLNIRADAGDPTNKSGTNPGGSSLNNGDQLRNFPGFSQIAQQENTSNASYNGFQTGIRAQNKHGLTGEFDYTWSHEIDLTSDDNNCCLSNPYNLKYDRGSGGLDRRHIVSANYIYKLPIFTQGNGLTHSLIGGWEIAGVVAAQSGVILNNTAGGNAYGGPGLSIGYDTIGLGDGNQNRPNINGKVHYVKKFGQWFDQSVFSAPTPAWAGGANQGFGNASRDSVVGPGRLNFSTSLYKSFAIKEYAHFEFRAESFNTFNHTQFQNVGYQLGSGNFGQVTNTFDPRVLELGGKLIF